MTPKQFSKEIQKIYKARQRAHDTLLMCDIALDKLIKKLV